MKKTSTGLAFSSHPAYENSTRLNSSSTEIRKPLKETSPVFSTIYKTDKDMFFLNNHEPFELEKDTDRFEHALALAMTRFQKGTNDDWSIGWKRGWSEGFKHGFERAQTKKQKMKL